MLKFELEGAILAQRLRPGCFVLLVHWLNPGFVRGQRAGLSNGRKKTTKKTKNLSHKIRAHTSATQTCTRMHAQTTRHVFINWRASQTRTSAELINNNLDKLSLSDHSARPNNRTTDETIRRTRHMSDSPVDQRGGGIERRCWPGAQLPEERTL